MTRVDLLDTTRCAQGVPQSPVKSDGVADLDDQQLRRVVVLIRAWMQRRINRHSATLGRSPYFCDSV